MSRSRDADDARSTLEVVEWIGDAAGRVESCGGLGGWFNWHVQGQRWSDYLAALSVEERPYAEALRTSIVATGIRHGGDWHQHSKGTPLFSDGSIGQYSFRGWGDLLAAVWSDQENHDYCYMDFYMCCFAQCGC